MANQRLHLYSEYTPLSKFSASYRNVPRYFYRND